VLFGARQKGHKLVRGRTQVADASIGRQRTDVQQELRTNAEIPCCHYHPDEAVIDLRAAGENYNPSVGRSPPQASLRNQAESESTLLGIPVEDAFQSIAFHFKSLFAVAPFCLGAPLLAAAAADSPPQSVVLVRGWQLQDVAKVPQSGAEVSTATSTRGWYAATVPGTVLTTLVNNHVYPEPLYGENNARRSFPRAWRTPRIGTGPIDHSRSYTRIATSGSTSTASTTPQTVWVNGAQVGTMRGAFIRGIFDITAAGEAGQAGRGRRAGDAAAASRRSRTSTRCATARAQRRHHGHRRADVSLARSAGTGFRPFATATPASGKRSFSPPPGRWW
jgi:hypothetical protein